MTDVSIPIDLMQRFYGLLIDLKRESVMTREVLANISKGLRDLNGELENIRTFSRRMYRIEESLGSSVEENRKTIAELEKTIADLHHHTGAHPLVDDPTTKDPES